jgi:carboxylesterase type B
MKDQEAGFEWIRDNIEAFGGDPRRVTAYGLSAGGTMSSLHLMEKRDKPPFTQLWAMSGPPGSALNMSDDAATFHTLQVAEKLQCNQEEEEAQLKCLRQVPMQKLLEVSMEYSVANNLPAGLFTFIPTVDGDLVPDRSTQLYRNGQFAKGKPSDHSTSVAMLIDVDIPTVLGWTQDDGTMNAGPANLVNEETDIRSAIKRAFRKLTTKTITELLVQYKASEFTQDVENYQRNKASTAPDVSVHWFRLSRMLRDILFTCPSIDFGFQMNKQSQNSQVYLYSLNQSMLTPLWSSVGMPYIGISYGSDTNYIFNGLFPEGETSDEDQKLSIEFATAFIAFANTGNPNECATNDKDVWPKAFATDPDQRTDTTLSAMNLQIIGGPYGTGRVSLATDSRYFGSGNTGYQDASHAVIGEQHALGDTLNLGAMPSPTSRMRKEVMGQEHLLRRCDFINGLSQELGT